MQFIDLQAQLKRMRPAIDRRIRQVMDHGQFIMGSEVQELEQALSEFTGSNHCISCANGTDALQIALMAMNIGENDLVFTTSFSFFATAEVIPLVGATPVFVDIALPSFNLDPQALEKTIQECIKEGKGTPKAVIAVDLFGLPADYPQIRAICEKYDLKLVEDAAQSFGAGMNAQKCGAFGDIATTSFFPAKPLGCFGDGGALFTNDDSLADKCRSFRVHGKGENKYQNVRIGLNSRLDTLQAAVLLEKLVHVEEERMRREALAQRYSSAFAPFCQTPEYGVSVSHAWAQYTLMLPQGVRADFSTTLQRAGIPTQIYYPTPLHQQPAFAHLDSPSLPNAERASQTCISLPVHAYLEAQQIEHILQTTTAALGAM